MPAPALNFDGVGNGFTGPNGTFTVNAAPPDTNGDVGPNHYVQIVNTDFAVFNKTGTALYGPVPTNTLWSGFGGGCQTNNDGDPRSRLRPDRRPLGDQPVLGHDDAVPAVRRRLADRRSDRRLLPVLVLVRHQRVPGLPEDGRLARRVLRDLQHVQRRAPLRRGAKVCAFDRARMLTGAAATQQCFNTSTTYGGLLPSDLDGATPPPAGSPNYVVSLGTGTNDLAYWKFHVDWTTPRQLDVHGPDHTDGGGVQPGLRRRHLHPAGRDDASSSTRSPTG